MNSLLKTENDNIKVLSVSEFAKAIGRTERQVYRYIQDGRLQTVSAGRGARIPESEVGRFLETAGSASGVWSKIKGPAKNEGEFHPEPMTDGADDYSESEEPVQGTVSSAGPEKVKSSEIPDPYESAEYMAESESVSGEFDAESDAASSEENGQKNGDPASVPLERHEAAVMRLGYLQSQLEQVQHLLSDGTEKDKEKDQSLKSMAKELDDAQKEIIRLEAKIEAANENRKEAELRANSLAVRLEVAEREASLPWWKRIFS